MKIKPFLIAFAIILTFKAFGQEPFDVASVDYPTVEIVDYSKSFGFGQRLKTKTGVKTSSITGNNLNVFSGQSLSFLTGDEITVPSLKSNFITYRLGVFSYKAKRNNTKKGYSIGDTIRYYLPLIIMSKFSLNYDSANTTALNDASSFSGSPLTVRLMPSYDFRLGAENTLTLGMIADFRGVFSRDSLDIELSSDFGFYFSTGLKYSGRGEVRDGDGQTYSGSWSISTLFYNISGEKSFEENLLYQNRGKNGLEFILRFKVLDTKATKFNLFANAQYQFGDFSNTDNSPWLFKFGIGN